MPAPHSRPSSRPRAALVVVAAGRGGRVGHERNKVLLPLAGRPILVRAIESAASLPEVDEVVVVVRESDRPEVEASLAECLPDLGATVVGGGATRHDSEWQALKVLRPAVERGDLDVILIHDGARPLVSARLVREVIRAASEHGGALPVVDQPALLATGPAAASPGPVARRAVAVQTPQAFRAGVLLAAYARADAEGFVGTDTASCVERYGDTVVRCVPGEATNLKVTFPEDLRLAERLLERLAPGLSGR